MPVTSSTVGGVNCWQFSGAVTDAEIRTAWSALIVNQEYVPARAIYLDSTCDLTAVQGGFFVNINFATAAFILHASRDKTKTVFRNWNFRQTAGISVANRTLSVRSWNGTTLTALSGSSTDSDGVDMFAGSFTYAVVGNPGGGDPRYLDEFAFGTLDGGTLITSSAFTEQELQPDIRGPRELKGVVFVRCFGFPQATGTFSRIVMWRCFQNSMHPTQRLVRAYGGANICYIDSTLRRNNAPVTNTFIDTFGGAVTNLLVLNGYLDETWFGATKTAFLAITGWNVNSTLRGGIYKRFQFVGAGSNGTVKVYDSRSTTTPARSTFVGTAAADFIAATTGTQTDSEGRVQIVVIGAQMNSNLSIVRYTGQKYTYQQFGKRVTVTDIDMTKGGDNDLSAYAPIVLTDQDGIARTQAAINAATTITSFQDLLEELHVLAIGLSGSASYAGAYTGNLFTFAGGTLTTAFSAVVVDGTAVSKIAYNSATNTLTIKATTLVGNATVQSWSNATGTVTLQNGAAIQGVYTSSAGTSTNLELRDIKPGAAYIVANNATKATILFGTNATGTAQDYTVYFPPGSAGTAVYVARQGYGDQFDFEVITLVAGAMWYQFTDIPDEGISQPTLATVQAYTTLENTSKLYDYVAAYRMTESGIKLGSIVIRAGTQLQFGSYSGVVNHNPASGLVFSITGSTITIKASALDGTTRYNTIVATPPATWVGHTNEEINCEVEDANGDSSVNIQAAAISTFEIWKITDATAPDDYATGTLIDTVGIGKYRFIHVDGYKMVIRDTTTNFRVVSEMEKGTYTAELFFGASVQLAQAAEVSEINNKVDALQIDVTNLPSAVWAFIVETGHSALAMMRLMASVLVGKVSGAGTGTEVFRDLGDTKDRVISSVDANGNRTNVTKDGS